MNLEMFRPRCAALIVTGVLSLCAPRFAAADALTLMWDPTPEQVAGYAVYVGVQPGTYTQRYDVGGATAFTLSSATAGQQYCFAVSAYSSPSVEGPKSTEVCGFSDASPTLNNPGNQSASVGQPATLQLVGTDPDGQPLTYSATGLPPGLTVMATTGFISGTGTTAGTYAVTAHAWDGVLAASQSFTWTMSAAPGDTTPPTVTISGPTTAATYATATSSLALSGTGADGIGVTQVSWANNRGGSGTATGTTSWSVASIALLGGSNVITVTARDAAGNQSTDVLTVTYTLPDTTPPTVTIAGPTSAATFATTSSSLTLSGTGADTVGVTQVTWVNSLGGSGTASGTTNWSTGSIALRSGANIITVTARDAAGNQGTDVLTVTYTSPVDTTPPTAAIAAPTTATTYGTASSSLALSGTSADAIGVTQVSWVNNRGGSGVATGTTSWSVASIALLGGSNVITVTARDAAGNLGFDVLTVTYTLPDTTPPTVTIAGPTTAATYAATSSSLALSGTSADGIGVTQVSWVNDRGGSGTATSTTSWSVGSIALLGGSNVITVTARDAAGNQSTDVLTVTYAPLDTVVLGAMTSRSRSKNEVHLKWTTSSWTGVYVYRNGVRVSKTSNDGSFKDSFRSDGSYSYKVCAPGTSICSNTITVFF